MNSTNMRHFLQIKSQSPKINSHVRNVTKFGTGLGNYVGIWLCILKRKNDWTRQPTNVTNVGVAFNGNGTSPNTKGFIPEKNCLSVRFAAKSSLLARHYSITWWFIRAKNHSSVRSVEIDSHSQP